MKKWIIGILVLLVIFVVSIYALIPPDIKIVNATFFKSNVNAVQRTLNRRELWDQWGSGQFKLTKRLSNGVDILSMSAHIGIPGEIIVLPLKSDSVAARWEAAFPRATGPFEKLSHYLQARAMKNTMNEIMVRFKNYCENDSNIYGLNIQQTSTRDTFLIATKFFGKYYPSADEIYSNINRLRQFVAENNLAETGFPMLNVTPVDSNSYKAMVAVPIDRIVEGKKDIFFVRMVPGKFLTTELKGGPYKISEAHRNLNQYFNDYSRTSMAIPFEYLVTDRQMEKDTANWVTKLYYPVY